MSSAIGVAPTKTGSRTPSITRSTYHLDILDASGDAALLGFDQRLAFGDGALLRNGAALEREVELDDLIDSHFDIVRLGGSD